MSTYRHLDDAVLLALLMKEEDAIWQTAYAVFREPFVRFFQDLTANTLSIDRCLEGYKQAFTIFLIEINNEALRPPVHTYVFHSLLIIGKKVLDKEYRPTWKDIAFEKVLVDTNKYLVQDVLLALAVKTKENNIVFNEFYKIYNQPAHEIVNRKGNFKNGEAEDSYSYSMLIFWRNMTERIIQPPFEGSLFNYFLVIFWRRTRDDMGRKGHKKKKIAAIEDELTALELETKSKEWRVDMREWEAHLKEPTMENNTYVDYLIDQWRVLQRFNFENVEDLAVQIIEQTTGRLKTILQLRYLEGLSFKDIAAHLDTLKTSAQIEPETADTIRKAHFDGIKKLKRILTIFTSRL